jgi:hypothetical protein
MQFSVQKKKTGMTCYRRKTTPNLPFAKKATSWTHKLKRNICFYAHLDPRRHQMDGSDQVSAKIAIARLITYSLDKINVNGTSNSIHHKYQI